MKFLTYFLRLMKMIRIFSQKLVILYIEDNIIEYFRFSDLFGGNNFTFPGDVKVHTNSRNLGYFNSSIFKVDPQSKGKDSFFKIIVLSLIIYAIMSVKSDTIKFLLNSKILTKP
jgi:hypothetical protein